MSKQNGRDGETPKKRKADFLKAFADTSMVTEAAKQVGVGRATVYRWRNEDPEFAEAWGEVEEAVTEDLETTAIRRAKEGSDVLLIFLLKAHRPDKYRERLSIDDDREEARRRKQLERASDEELDEALTGLDDNVVPIRKEAA